MEKNLFLISIRYVCISYLFFIMGQTNTQDLTYVLLFLFIVNNQIRFFTLHKMIQQVISLVVEIVLIWLLMTQHQLATVVLLIPFVIDTTTVLSQKYLYTFLFIGGLLCITIPNQVISYIITSLLCLYIKDEQTKKLDAHHLYDEIRHSQKQLQQANLELEEYAQSISELTTLQERNRISREIHDSVGHALSTAMIQLSAMEQIAKREQSSLESMAGTLREFIKSSYHEVRTVISDLKDFEHENSQILYRLNELVSNFSKLSGVKTQLTVSKERFALSSKQSTVIYRVVQEGLSNALRHGYASKVLIFLTFENQVVRLLIKDNGKGCASVNKGVGLLSMGERIEELNGRFSYNTSPNEGFILTVTIPKGESYEDFNC